MIHCPQLLSTNEDGDCSVLVDYMCDDFASAVEVAKKKEGTLSPVFTPAGNKVYQVTWVETWDSYTWYKVQEADRWAKDQDFREESEMRYHGVFA